MNKKYAIVILLYERVQKFKKLIHSLEKCSDLDKFDIVIIYQNEVIETANFINTLNGKYIILDRNGENNTALENITINSILGFKYCFEKKNYEKVVMLEDDVILASDALSFSIYVDDKFAKDSNYICCSLSSMYPYKKEYCDKFIKICSSMHGDGFLLNKHNWNKIKKNCLDYNYKLLGLDRLTHLYFMSSGYTIFPLNSRLVNDGWGGTHYSDKADITLDAKKNSFVGEIDVTKYFEYNKINKNKITIYSFNPNILTYFFFKIFFLFDKFLLKFGYHNFGRKFLVYLKVSRRFFFFRKYS